MKRIQSTPSEKRATEGLADDAGEGKERREEETAGERRETESFEGQTLGARGARTAIRKGIRVRGSATHSVRPESAR